MSLDFPPADAETVELAPGNDVGLPTREVMQVSVAMEMETNRFHASTLTMGARGLKAHIVSVDRGPGRARDVIPNAARRPRFV
jgi:hypothetical protein